VLDAWRTRWQQGVPRWVGLGIGILLLLTLVTLIHLLFWAQFLPTAESAALGWMAQILYILLITSYGLLYYRSGSMWPTFFVHLAADVQLVVLSNYSILPYL
jgi:membrane protease YdiL (CAAX protease family)